MSKATSGRKPKTKPATKRSPRKPADEEIYYVTPQPLDEEGKRRLEAWRQMMRQQDEAWAKMSDAERAQEARDWERFKKSMNESHSGGRIPYPD
jgi:uncharacterized damage-inducible protein DinB